MAVHASGISTTTFPRRRFAVELIHQPAQLLDFLGGERLRLDEVRQQRPHQAATKLLRHHAEALAQELAVLAPLSVAAAKRAILDGLETTLAGGLTIEAYEMYGVSTTSDCLEGVQSFVEKRQPRFTGA